MGLMEKIASWWIGLSRADLDAEAERRAQQWKIEKKNLSHQVHADAFRDGWDLGILNAQRKALGR